MAKNELSFEGAVSRLDEIVSALDNGTAELDKSLALYEEGIKLVRLCTSKLDEAEAKISILQRDAEGNLSEAEFEEEK